MAECVDCNLCEFPIHWLFHNWDNAAFILLPIPITYISIQHLKSFKAGKPFTTWLPSCCTQKHALRWLAIYLILLPVEVLEGVWIVNFQLSKMFPVIEWRMAGVLKLIVISCILVTFILFWILWMMILLSTGAAIKELYMWPLRREPVILESKIVLNNRTELEIG